MCTNENAKQTFLEHLPVPVQHNPGFICWKQTHMQISCKPVVQACNDFEILMHTSKG